MDTMRKFAPQFDISGWMQPSFSSTTLLGARRSRLLTPPKRQALKATLGLIQDGGGSSTTTYSATVFVKAVNVKSGEIVWSGNARYGEPVTSVNEALVKLTRQALATAWGFRPVGPHEISSDSMCLIETQVNH
jgi:hypothetical protein